MSAKLWDSDELGRWFRCHRPNPSARVRLYCIPYAGGGPVVFRTWPDHFPDAEIWGIHLPGRESRMREPAHTNMNALLDGLAPAVAAHATGSFSIFGHSLGAMVAFELTRRLEAVGGIGPQRLFLSGHGAPSRYIREEATHELPHGDFLERIRSFDGTPDAVLQNDELMAIFLPLLRADIQLLETYDRDPESWVACPIVALGAEDDPEVPMDSMEAWQAHTRADFDLHRFEGGHFYWQQNPVPMIETIRSAL